MTIREVEQKTGISKQNIRFYEKEKLIAPSHNSENGYREYTEGDVARLNEIKLFRKLGIAIPDILKMLRGEMPISDCMKNYSGIASVKINEVKKQKMLFDRIALEFSPEKDFPVKEYLEVVETEEQRGVKFFNIVFDFATKAKNYLGKGVRDFIMKKGFDIQLEEALRYPTVDTVCEAIAAFCAADQQKCEFVSKSSPVTFRLDGVLYQTSVGLARGGYCLFCKEV